MSALGPPENLSLPCFVYGVFKPGELAFHRLERLLSSLPEKAEAAGSLRSRDGLPLFVPGGSGSVPGYVLRFSKHTVGEAYAAICDVEPDSQYRWQEAGLRNSDERVNLLVGVSPNKGSVEVEDPYWTSRQDPVFTEGITAVEEVTRAAGSEQFESRPPHCFEWGRFFQLQMAYLLLWSAIERYTALRFGPALDPLDRVKRLGTDDPFFAKAVAQTVTRSDRVFDTRDPGDHYDLRRDKPRSASLYYYQIRNNLSHRGKGAWGDGEKVRLALMELLAIFKEVLAHSVFHTQG